MPFEWHAYLTFASELRDAANNREEAYRTVIGRAYYTVYNYAKEHADSQKQGITSSGVAGGKGVHEQLIAHYLNYSNIDRAAPPDIVGLMRKISFKLKTMYELRLAADYSRRFEVKGLSLGDPAAKANDSLTDAEELMKMLSDLKQAENDRRGIRRQR